MAMRYHWGFAVGHVYTHEQTAALVSPSTGMSSSLSLSRSGSEDEERDEEIEPTDPDIPRSCESDGEDSELGFEDRQDDTLDDNSEDPDDYFSDDSDELIAMANTYGF